MVKKIYLLLLLLTNITGYAQKAAVKPVTRALLQANPRALSANLSQRVNRTYINALRTQEWATRTTLNQYTVQYATKKLTTPLPVQHIDLIYPQLQGRITTDKQFSRYFLAQNNREAIKKIKLESQSLAWMEFLTHQLKQIQITNSHPPHEDMRWLAEQIPLDTDYLLLAEQHLFSPIQETLTTLLPIIQNRFKGRPIVLLSEALPTQEVQARLSNDKTLRPTVPLDYIEFLTTAKQLGFYVTGLEPLARYLLQGKAITASKENSPIWAIPEGMRIRNNAWLEEINNLRAQTPNALFIIHGGMFHLDYTNIHSVGKALKNTGNTYLVSFLPGYTTKNVDSIQLSLLQRKYYWFHPEEFPQTDFLPVSTFDLATRGQFPQRIVQFKNIPLNNSSTPLRTGFDVQIKVPAIAPEE